MSVYVTTMYMTADEHRLHEEMPMNVRILNCTVAYCLTENPIH